MEALRLLRGALAGWLPGRAAYIRSWHGSLPARPAALFATAQHHSPVPAWLQTPVPDALHGQKKGVELYLAGYDSQSVLDDVFAAAQSSVEKGRAISAFEDHLEATPKFMEHRQPAGGWSRGDQATKRSTGNEHAFMVRCMVVALLATAAMPAVWQRSQLLIAALVGERPSWLGWLAGGWHAMCAQWCYLSSVAQLGCAAVH